MKDLSFCPLTSSTSSSFPVSLPRLTVSCTPARNTCKNSSHQLRSPFSALFPTTCHSFALGLNTRLFVKYYRVLVVLASGSFTPSSTHSANWHLSDLRMHSSKGVSPLLRSFQWLLITIGQLFFFFSTVLAPHLQFCPLLKEALFSLLFACNSSVLWDFAEEE